MINGGEAKKVTGKVITSNNITDHNTFDNPDNVSVKEFTDIKISKGKIDAMLPSKSVVLIQVN
jgi:alpha-N-arabinofuranosidase